MKRCDFLVIGGGSAGMIAAIAAGASGVRTVLVERNGTLGRKLALTGNNRCNLTNTHISAKGYHGSSPAFVGSLLLRHGSEWLRAFFEERGCVLVEDGSRVFTHTGEAKVVTHILQREMEALGVEILLNTKVSDIRKGESGFGVSTDDGTTIEARRVLVACGGKAYPKTGSDGSGFDLARSLGHSIVEPSPGLVPLLTERGPLRDLQGVKMPGRLSVIGNGTVIAQSEGDILFTSQGVSGTAALAVSRAVSTAEKGALLILRIGFMTLPEKSECRILSSSQAEEFLKNRWLRQRNLPVSESFVGVLPMRVAPILLRALKIDPGALVGDLQPQILACIARAWTGWDTGIEGTAGFEQAQVTVGGVRTDEVDPETFESKIVDGLYLAGEVLDIDGDTGGFNLHFAFASGHAAGVAVSQRPVTL